MAEKEDTAVSAPAEQAAAESVSGSHPAEAGAPEAAKEIFVRKVKNLVGDFVDYAKNTDL